MTEFTVKHGTEQLFPSGFRRNTDEEKTNYNLIHIPFLTRIANHLTKGAKIHGRDNWKLANSKEELQRCEDAAFRHLMQYLDGERDEDHASAVVFNLMVAEYIRERLPAQEPTILQVVVPENLNIREYLKKFNQYFSIPTRRTNEQSDHNDKQASE